jgi:trigger factor
MQVTETLNEGLKRAYTVTVSAAEIAGKVEAKLAEVRPKVAMKGFRPGKVPMALLRKQHGPRLLGEAVQETIDGAVSGHLAASGHRPAMQPAVKIASETWQEGQDVVIELSYETLPDVPDLDLSTLSLTRLTVEPDEAAVAEALGRLAEGAKTYEDRKKGAKAKDGDQLVLDFTGRVGGEPFEGGSATDFPLVLGSNAFLPGFEAGLVGAKAGEEREVTVTFPENYGAAHLAGKEAVFAVAVKAVKEPKAPDLDDMFAQRFGADTLDALKTQIREQLGREFAQAARQVAKRALLDALDARVDFPLPEALVDAEARQIAHQLWHEEHPEVKGHDHGPIEPSDDHLRLARRRVKLGLLLADIGQKAEIKVTDQELTQAVIAEARRYRGQERQFFDYVQKNAAARQQLQAPIYEDKVVDHIFAAAAVEDRSATREELQAAVAALDQE